MTFSRLAVLALALTAAAPTARAASVADLPLIGGWFAEPQKLSMTEAELTSLGCLTFSAGAVGVTVVLGGAAAVATGGAASASVVAAPVLVGVAAAGCAFGSAAAPGLTWIGRNSDILFQRISDALPPLPSPPGLSRP